MGIRISGSSVNAALDVAELGLQYREQRYFMLRTMVVSSRKVVLCGTQKSVCETAKGGDPGIESAGDLVEVLDHIL